MGLFDILYTDCNGFINLRALRDDYRASQSYKLHDYSGISKFINMNADKNLFFAVATRDGNGGKKENIVNIPALWSDIDFKDSSEENARKLLKEFPLEPSALIESGYGLHAYWKLTEPAEYEDIAEVEKILRGLASVLCGDPNATDASRLLRIPKTTNWKYTPPRIVNLISTNAKTYNLSDFDFLPEKQETFLKTKPHNDLEKIMQCKFLQHCSDNAAVLPEPEWYAMITQLARIPGGPAEIHKLSKSHPKYKKQETDNKILHAINDSGPITCDRIRQLWNCGKNCGVGSPAALSFRSCDDNDDRKNGNSISKNTKRARARVANEMPDKEYYANSNTCTMTTNDDNDDKMTTERRQNDDNSEASLQVFEFTTEERTKLLSSGMTDDDITNVCEIINKTSEKEFDSLYVENICRHVVVMLSSFCRHCRHLSSSDSEAGNLAKDIREWIECFDGIFEISDIFRDLNIRDRTIKKNCSKILERLCNRDNIIEKHGERRGVFRIIETKCDEIDWWNAETDALPIRWPFQIEQLVEFMPGNIAVIAGEPNAGKTAFLLNFAEKNLDSFNVHYFSSEMGPKELKKRILNFGEIGLRPERFKPVRFLERSSNFADVLTSGSGNINIIDFMEMHADFWRVGGMLKEIHDKLDGAVAVVAIQKNKTSDTGLGGGRGLEKPRIYLNMAPGKLTIVKGKNWTTQKNPNGLSITFNLFRGAIFKERAGWQNENKNGR